MKTILFVGFQDKIDALRAAKNYGCRVLLLLDSEGRGFESYVDRVFSVKFDHINELNSILHDIENSQNVYVVLTNDEVYTIYRAYVAEYLKLEHDTLLNAASVRNKILMRKCWKDLAENVDYHTVTNLDEACEAFDQLGGDVYLKFVAGVKSSLVYHVSSKCEMKRAFEDLLNGAQNIEPEFLNHYEQMDFGFKYPDPSTVFLVEKAEYGRQVTIASVVAKGRILHAPGVCDVYTAKDVGVNDSFLAFRVLPAQHSLKVENRIKNVVEAAVKAMGVDNCMLHSELILKEDGSVKLIEIAARVGGYRARMYREAYDFCLHRLLFNAIFGGEIVALPQEAVKYVSMMEIFPLSEGKFHRVENWEKLESDPLVVRVNLKKEYGDLVGKARNGYKRVADIMLSDCDPVNLLTKSFSFQEKLVVKVSEAS